jgi:hypothetical protein
MFGVILLCAPELNFPQPVLLLIHAAVFPARLAKIRVGQTPDPVK